MDNLHENLCENLQKIIFFSLTPVLKATILFESRQFEHRLASSPSLKIAKVEISSSTRQGDPFI